MKRITREQITNAMKGWYTGVPLNIPEAIADAQLAADQLVLDAAVKAERERVMEGIKTYYDTMNPEDWQERDALLEYLSTEEGK